MIPASQFEVVRREGTLNFSGKFTSAYLAANSGTGGVAGTLTAVRGLALGAHATDGESLDLAGANSYIGNLTRRVVVGGAQLQDRVFGPVSAVPVGVEFPFPDGAEVTVEVPKTIEAEGSDYLVLSGTGAITNGTAVGAKLSFSSGKLYVAQTGDTPFFLLTANSLTSSDGSSLRIRAEKI
jgi:hypothetical protein